MNFLKNPPKKSVDYPGYSSNENINFSFIGYIFGDTANIKFGRFTVSIRPLFQED